MSFYSRSYWMVEAPPSAPFRRGCLTCHASCAWRKSRASSSVSGVLRELGMPALRTKHFDWWDFKENTSAAAAVRRCISAPSLFLENPLRAWQWRGTSAGKYRDTPN
mgnify:CR=1 FL=1